jgi:hypothetical protein
MPTGRRLTLKWILQELGCETVDLMEVANVSVQWHDQRKKCHLLKKTLCHEAIQLLFICFMYCLTGKAKIKG